MRLNRNNVDFSMFSIVKLDVIAMMSGIACIKIINKVSLDFWLDGQTIDTPDKFDLVENIHLVRKGCRDHTKTREKKTQRKRREKKNSCGNKENDCF